MIYKQLWSFNNILLALITEVMIQLSLNILPYPSISRVRKHFCLMTRFGNDHLHTNIGGKRHEKLTLSLNFY